QIVAVTKGFGPWAIEAAVGAGAAVVGESYAQELEAKAVHLDEHTLANVDIHFIGAMQTNKVRKVAHLVAVWQSVDRASLVREIAKRDPGAQIMLQLDIAGVEGQGGCDLADAPQLLAEATDLGLDVVGVMAIGPQDEPAAVQAAFERMTAFADRHSIAQRSMGMTGDLESAVAAGTTMIRVGTALFGERPPR
ncbi:MAG: YggS family pyridoxal phosphate-dependent enzyme, partial [Actinomycetota bacterium]|nr:YggS family pyridoxal phosphate-dependent enzyme [Actinomycetota bacterium]